jgi:hypothetical protein
MRTPATRRCTWRRRPMLRASWSPWWPPGPTSPPSTGAARSHCTTRWTGDRTVRTGTRRRSPRRSGACSTRGETRTPRTREGPRPSTGRSAIAARPPSRCCSPAGRTRCARTEAAPRRGSSRTGRPERAGVDRRRRKSSRPRSCGCSRHTTRRTDRGMRSPAGAQARQAGSPSWRIHRPVQECRRNRAPVAAVT